MQATSIGIHIIVMPENLNTPISLDAVKGIQNAVALSCTMHLCTLYESYVAFDHIHILVEASTEESAVQFLPEVIQSMLAEIKQSTPDFEFANGVHVTILPPWHLEVLAAFVRDQARYHQTKTVQQELDLIFKPGRIGSFELDDPPIPEHVSTN